MNCPFSVTNNNGCLSFLIDLLGMKLLHLPPMDCLPSALSSNLNSNSHSLLRTFLVINCRWVQMAPLGEGVRGCSANSKNIWKSGKRQRAEPLVWQWGEFYILLPAPRLCSDPWTSRHRIVNIAVPLCPAPWRGLDQDLPQHLLQGPQADCGWLISWPCKPYLLLPPTLQYL